MSKPLLTVGMATYDEYDSTWSTLSTLRLQLRTLLPNNHEFVVINNHPDGKDTPALVELMKPIRNGKLIAHSRQGTGSRQKIFEHANGVFTLCIDCHISIDFAGLTRLISFISTRQRTNDLYHGVLLLNDFVTRETHMEPIWRDKMFGAWGSDARRFGEEAFEIPMHGLGLFLCRTEAWPGFNPLFRGFGGEEGYIHFKFRNRGDKTWCLPWLEWVHKFRNKRPTPYVNKLSDRIYNYFVGWHEVGEPEQSIIDHFSKFMKLSAIQSIQQQAHADWAAYVNNKIIPEVQEITPGKTTSLAAVRQMANYVVGLPLDQRQRFITELKRTDSRVYKMLETQLKFLQAAAQRR